VIPLILVLVVTAIVFGFGFVATWLFAVAAVLFVVWSAGFFTGRGGWYGL
jgi:multisubunit Na+/H+ antiporter MnhC subunit